jgi:hypothetical protein
VTPNLGVKMSSQGIFVNLYTEEQVLRGSIFLPSYLRISDFLNEKVVGSSKFAGPFLELTKNNIMAANDIKETMGIERVNKTALRMLATPNTNSARGIGGKHGPKNYPFVQKFPVRVKMHVSNYELTGKVHRTSNQGIRQLLEDTRMFLPITDAKISVDNSETLQTAFFVAVNKEYVSFMEPQESFITL